MNVMVGVCVSRSRKGVQKERVSISGEDNEKVCVRFLNVIMVSCKPSGGGCFIAAPFFLVKSEFCFPTSNRRVSTKKLAQEDS